MKTVIKTSIGGPFLRPYCVLTAIALGLFALSPGMQAVTPPPDGGYPGENTAEGQSALLHLAGGTYNTALGWASLGFNVTGNFNTGVGAATLLNTTGDNNTATGAGAILSNTSGNENTANGAFALFNNTTGVSNTANGAEALFSNTSGLQNTATGGEALYHNRTINGISGSNNTANGFAALFHNSNGTNNTAIGASALVFNTTGGQNTAIGVNALQLNMTGHNNTALGYQAGSGVSTANNVICIGADGNNVDNACYIGQIFGATSSGGTAVFVNSNGRLGTATSSQRFKDDIKLMDQASEALFALNPVTFRYKKEIDPQGIAQFGLVAEEVEKVDPDLVIRDAEGKPQTVRYEQINAMLLNEFLKEHKKVEEQKNRIDKQETTIGHLEKQIGKLTAIVTEQTSLVQKLSARSGTSEPEAQIALNNP